MPAFEKVPAYMRAHLASLTNGTRFIGGSADTVYLPGRYYSDFMHVLGIFLETDCFLEIATPTALHLVVPAADEIQFLDHVSEQPSICMAASLRYLTVVDLGPTFQCHLCQTKMGGRFRSRHIPYFPLG